MKNKSGVNARDIIYPDAYIKKSKSEDYLLD